MADFHVIANVSETLVSIVTKALETLAPAQGDPPVAQLHDLHETPSLPDGSLGMVCITLVEVREEPTSRNRPRVPISGNPAQRFVTTKPPMALRLRYILSPWSGADPNLLFEHEMLGCVAAAFYDHAILSGDDLSGTGDPDPFDPQKPTGLKGSGERLAVTLAQLNLEDQTRFWHALQQKYRVSLTYDVRVVNLSPTTEQSEALVSSRTLEFGMVRRP